MKIFMHYASLFTPFTYKTLHMRNRFVMAPMTRQFSPGGIPTREVGSYYERRAAGEVGLILTEGTVINRPGSKNAERIPDFYGDAPLAAWKGVADRVHAAGGAIAPQIWHVGNTPLTDWRPEGGLEGPASMSVKDIENTIAAFGEAAANARALGFDALELHGAHGYLIDQFFWSVTNTRTDGYGGRTLKERSRFAVEVVKAVRAAAGEDMTIILRLSQWKGSDYTARLAGSPKELEEWVLPLASAGVDIFHGSQRRYWEPEFAGSDLNFAGWLKKVTGQPTITVGSVGLSGADVLASFKGEGAGVASLDDLYRRFERGDFDLVAVGRSILQDPLWVKKLREERFTELQAFRAESMQVLH